MSSLREFQADFLNDIYDRTFESAKYLTDGKAGDKKRLRIYRNNAIFILSESLSETFPVLEKLVGEKFFFMLAREYLAEFPQPSGNQFSFGEHLPSFLRTYVKGLIIPYLSDVAALEWARHISYYADDIKYLTFETLTKEISKDENYILKPAATAHLIDTTYNVLDIWQVHQAEDIHEITLEKKAHSVLIWRTPNNELNMMRLSPHMEQFLKSCKKGDTFMSVMTDLSLTEEGQESFQSEFARLVAAGVFTS